MYPCYQQPAARYIRKLISARWGIITSAPASTTAPPLQSSLHHRLRPWSWLRWGGAAFPGGPCPVDRCCSCTALLVSTKRTVASCFSWRFPFPVDRCCSCTTLLVSTKRTAALPWCATQVHTQNVLSKCTPKDVLSKCTPKNHKCGVRGA